MTLRLGDRLGPYQATAKIGEGGMGEVYRARDTTLDRDVALKVLPDAVATDPDRMARFEREAKLLASLSHGGIAAIFGTEDDPASGTRALVLELVEGPTLAERIAEGPIPVPEAVAIATQIAEALEAAHEAGVIHRDLKPANIKVRDDGTVKVLDFGLAKALSPVAAGGAAGGATDPNLSPTLTAATQVGVILGTAAYMSPEQAKGRSVDKRADIWAFGAVLYEMLTGTPLFEADDVSEVLASVLLKEPDVAALGPDVPAGLRSLVGRCLVKDPRDRLRDIGEARLALRASVGTADADGGERSAPPGPTPRRWLRPLPLATVALGLVLLGVGFGELLRSGPHASPGPVTRFRIAVEGRDLMPSGASMALSPDGSQLVYAASDQLYLRSLDELEARPIAGTEGASAPVFAPDGQWIAFVQRNVIRKISVRGGASVPLAGVPGPRSNPSWPTDDLILLTEAGGIASVPAEGGATTLLASLEEGELIHSPRLLPGGCWLLFGVQAAGDELPQVVAQSLETGERRQIVPGASRPHYLPSGHLLYLFANRLYASALDPARPSLAPAGTALVERVIDYDVSANGTLVYAGSDAESVLGWVGSEGAMTTVARAATSMRAPRISPDGNRIVMNRRLRELWVHDIRRDVSSRLAMVGALPIWAANGASISYSSNVTGAFDLYRLRADGGSEPERLLASPGTSIPGDWSPDGSVLAYHETNEQGDDRDLWLLRDGTPSPFLATPAEEFAPVVSPDGRWVAYVSDQSGALNVYSQPFPEGGQIVGISEAGGTEPVWARDGSALYFRDGPRMMAVSIQSGETLTVGPPRELFQGDYLQDPLGLGLRNYDVAQDGRFLMIRGGTGITEIDVVLNWTQELLERVPID